MVEVLEQWSMTVEVQVVLQVELVPASMVYPYQHREFLQVIRGLRSAGSACGRCVVV